MTVMVEVTQEDANNYCEVLRALGMAEEGDPVQGILMWQQWEAEAQARAELLEQCWKWPAHGSRITPRRWTATPCNMHRTAQTA